MGTDMGQIGERIKRARLVNELRQSDVAEKLDVTVMCVSHWENGSVDIPVSRILELSKFFGLSESYFFEPVNSHVTDNVAGEGE